MGRSTPRLHRATPSARWSRAAFSRARVREGARVLGLALAPSLVVFAVAQSARAQAGEGAAVSEYASPREHEAAAPTGSADDPVDWLVWSLDAGYRHVDLRKVSFDDGGDNHKLMADQSGGFSPGLGVGMRLWWITLVARMDITFLASQDPSVVDDSAHLWNLDLELGWGLHLHRVRPYLILGAGYSALGGFEDVVEDVPRFGSASGANLRGGVGIDYAPSKVVRLGVRGTADVLLLASETSVGNLLAPAQVDTLGQAEDRLRDADGSITALSFAPSATLSLSFF